MMDAVVRAAAIYLFLTLVMRAAGKRQFSEMTIFDFVLLLIVAEATQQGLLGQDFSVTYAMLVIVTLVGLDILLSIVKQHSRFAEKVIDGVPVLLVDNGELLRGPMNRERVDSEDIMSQARLTHGLERLDQVKYAILERDGKISIIPRHG
jgi:uncharacterized membrane protein YcaP (DUF421 family)